MSYIVKDNDTLKSISLDLGIPIAILCKLNNINEYETVNPGQMLQVSESIYANDDMFHCYTVQKGDTLIKIGKIFHCDYNLIKYINNITDEKKLQIGQSLIIITQDDLQKPLSDLIQPQSRNLIEVIEDNAAGIVPDFDLKEIIEYLLKIGSNLNDKIAVINIINCVLENKMDDAITAMIAFVVASAIEDIFAFKKMLTIILLFYSTKYGRFLALFVKFLLNSCISDIIDSIFK